MKQDDWNVSQCEFSSDLCSGERILSLKAYAKFHSPGTTETRSRRGCCRASVFWFAGLWHFSIGSSWSDRLLQIN